ncbi:MAG: N-acetylmuramic acid 6-phosphate etherase [Balneolaceae bacterium]
MNTDEQNDKLFRQLTSLMTEQRNPDSMQIDLATPEEIVHIINREDQKVASAVRTRQKEIANAIRWVAESIEAGGRLFYFGAGTSGRIGVVDAAECPPTFGVKPEQVQGFIAGGPEAMFRAQERAEDHEENGVNDVNSAELSPPDILCGLAASGRTPYVHGAVREARKRGCKTILVTTVPAHQVDLEVELMIDVEVGPEVIMGSTRMKSATAQKMVVNMITTGAMVQLGKVYENVMVDLMLTNRKLDERAKRIVMFLTDVPYRKAEEYLERADGHVKTAILMALTGLDPEAGRILLAQNGGFIRKALDHATLKNRSSDDNEKSS